MTQKKATKKEQTQENREKQKAKIIKKYIRLRKKKKDTLTYKDLQDNDISRATIRHYFNNLQDLHKHVRDSHPEIFKDSCIDEIIESNPDIVEDLHEYDKFVVTTAVLGCYADKNFLKSLQNYCKRNKARLIVLTCSDSAKRNSDWTGSGFIDKELQEYIIPGQINLNDNLFICNIKMSAKHIHPLQGLTRIAGKHQSFIAGMPKIDIETIPGTGEYPKLAMTTGAITVADYDTDMYKAHRTAYIANEDHCIGALVIEIENEKTYHKREIEAFSDGSFIDDGTRYLPNGTTKKEKAEVVVFGDIHVGSTCQETLELGLEACKRLKPQNLILHDLFDGMSVNHHAKDDLIFCAKRQSRNKDSLIEELKDTRDFLLKVSKYADKVHIIKSNHDEWIDKYLKTGRFLKDPINYEIGLILSLEVLKGKDPLEAGLDYVGGIPKNVRFNDCDDKLEFSKRTYNYHGHLGVNGARGSLPSLAKALEAIAIGHTHVLKRHRDSFSVGTFTLKRLGYNRGLSSWSNTFAVAYKGTRGRVGPAQTITNIEGKYRLEPQRKQKVR